VLGNLINRHDAVRLVRKLSKGQVWGIAGKVRTRGTERVVVKWSSLESSTQEWWAIPAMTRRWNTFASGDPDISFPQHVAATWLAGRPRLRALSLGCGTGEREMVWARLGVFDHLTGVDISPDPVEYANRQSKEAGLERVLTFRVADVRQLLHATEKYDVVLGLHSLHHFDHLAETMELIAGNLGPEGLLIVDEFVGPTKFQWTRAQMRAADGLLAALPPERRVQADGRIKRRVIRPSLLSMRLDDPSEAVEASELLPALRRRFTILEERPYGGSVLHIALSGIAQNFIGDDAATAELIQRCFAAEDEALPQLGHDFVFAVCSPNSIR
jgi:2-polyprenyl-3-methyl-5-hydroxy-6-metoxy-1,4-benzoquinol methylase